ncbi:MAG: response regulator transcription factor [Flavisolibacter sp.]|nr:response regulator transcription factor [Flavisolibacter sp.]
MKLLIVEDEYKLLQSIQDYFTQEDFVCEGVATYAEAMRRIEDFTYDCIILDVNLPDGSGFNLLNYLRSDKKEDGVIVISARDSLDDKLKGLNLGADDYLTKPFHLSELNARVKALIRRKYSKGSNFIEYGCIRLDLEARSVTCNGQLLTLTKNEFDLLLYLITNKNRVISKKAIAEHLFGEQADNLSSLDFVYSHIKNLKKKLKDKCADELIETVYGVGYKLSI